MIADVSQRFNDHISKVFVSKPEVRNFLLNHERKANCIANLCEQIRIAELSNIRHTFNVLKYSRVIESVVEMFCSACLKHKEEELLSRAERQKRLDEANTLEYAKELIQDLEDDAIDNTPRSFLNEANRS